MPLFSSKVSHRRESLWPASVGVLAVIAANIGDGDWARRSAIAWMIGSWGARLSVQALYAPGAERLGDFRFLNSDVRLATALLVFAMPAAIASRNPDPSLSVIELAACALWIIAFAAETTADRQWLRFFANPEHADLACRSGLWRYSAQAHAISDTLIWIAIALFASASPWGWIAFACPLLRAAQLALTVRHR